jgi:hypothetical protein
MKSEGCLTPTDGRQIAFNVAAPPEGGCHLGAAMAS